MGVRRGDLRPVQAWWRDRRGRPSHRDLQQRTRLDCSSGDPRVVRHRRRTHPERLAQIGRGGPARVHRGGQAAARGRPPAGPGLGCRRAPTTGRSAGRAVCDASRRSSVRGSTQTSSVSSVRMNALQHFCAIGRRGCGFYRGLGEPAKPARGDIENGVNMASLISRRGFTAAAAADGPAPVSPGTAMREPAMAAAPIASTDLCQRGLHRVRVILVHLFAHPGRRRPPTALRTDRNRSRHPEETRSAAQVETDLKARPLPRRTKHKPTRSRLPKQRPGAASGSRFNSYSLSRYLWLDA